MPMRRFWFYHKQAGRLKAEQDLRMLAVVASAQSGEAIEKLSKELRADLGDLIVFEPDTTTFDANAPDPEFDRAGLHAVAEKFGFKVNKTSKEESEDGSDQS